MALMHLYHGDGKGKTTAALGLALRAAGAGYRVVLAQFFKTMLSSELKSLAQIPQVTVIRGERDFGFTWTLSEAEQAELREAQNEILRRAIEAAGTGEQTLLVLDEAVSAYTYHYLDRQPLLDYLRGRPENVEVVLTGRNPEPELLELADYITEMKKIRHPFDRGIAARTGIED